MNKMTLRDVQVKGRRVLMRVDFNVPIKDGVVMDDTRIAAALPSIRYCLDQGASVVLMSHLGRPKGKGYEAEFSLKPVADYLAQKLGRPVAFAPDCMNAGAQVGMLKPGDVLMLGSVSGRNRGPVELALAARAMGVQVVGITAMTYTANVQSLHPTGKKLCDVCDVVVDNGAPYGDAAVDVPGYDEKMMPVSGVAAIVAGWMVWGRVMEKMAEAGLPPSTFISINGAGGQAYYDRSQAEFNKRGF